MLWSLTFDWSFDCWLAKLLQDCCKIASGVGDSNFLQLGTTKSYHSKIQRQDNLSVLRRCHSEPGFKDRSIRSTLPSPQSLSTSKISCDKSSACNYFSIAFIPHNADIYQEFKLRDYNSVGCGMFWHCRKHQISDSNKSVHQFEDHYI